MNTPQFDDAVNYVLRQLESNMSEEAIDQSLEDAGYSDELIDAIFDEVEARIAAASEQPSTFKQAVQAHDEQHADLFDSLWYIMKNLGLFQGRLGRAQYLVALICYMLASAAFSYGYFSYILSADAGLPTPGAQTGSLIGSGFTILFLIVAFTQYFSILSRRFHDFNMSGWAALTIFIPLVGSLIPIYLLFKQGTPTENLYGFRRAGFNYLDLFGWKLSKKSDKTKSSGV